MLQTVFFSVNATFGKPLAFMKTYPPVVLTTQTNFMSDEME